MSNTTLLSIVARIHPAIWDAIYPHGPVGPTGRLSQIALNPQPLPPHELFLLGAAETAHEIVRAALALEAKGESATTFVSDAIDDWCGTPWPHKWPRPHGAQLETWDPYDVRAGRVVAAIIFTGIAERITDDKFSAVFADGAERLTRAALDGGTTGRQATTTRTTGKTAKRR